MGITNLANLETLNGQPIKTGKKISFAYSSFSSVDAIVAFLAKFNLGVETLDFSKMLNLQSKLLVLSCSTHAIFNVIFSAIPDEISKLQNLKELFLERTAITSEWNQLYVAPMLPVQNAVFRQASPSSLGS